MNLFSIKSVSLLALATSSSIGVDAILADTHRIGDVLSREQQLEVEDYVQKHVFFDKLAPPTNIPLVRPKRDEFIPDSSSHPDLVAEYLTTKTSSQPVNTKNNENGVEALRPRPYPCPEELDENGNHHLRRLPRLVWPCDGPPNPPTPSPGPQPKYVRVLFLFTREVFWGRFWEHYYSSSGWWWYRFRRAIQMALSTIRSETQLMVNEMNQALANSAVIHRVVKQDVRFLTGISETDIRQFYGMSAADVTNGIFKSNHVLSGIQANIQSTNVEARRNAANADLVSIIVELNGMGSGGSVARPLEYYIGANPAENAYMSVVKLAKSRVYFQFAHEIGHNCGLGHDMYTCSYCGLMAGRGHVVKTYISDSQPGFRTIMAYRDGCCNGNSNCNEYADCFRIPHFSNPSVSYAGLPTGDNNADAASTLNHYMAQVANYR